MTKWLGIRRGNSLKRLDSCHVWLAFFLAATVFGYLVREEPVSPVAAPEAPLGYFCGEYPKPAPAAKKSATAWHTCRASFYGEDCGTRTASGERFREDAMTCAHKRLKFGTVLEVRKAGKVIRVRVTDRGPYVAGRELDLSKGAFARLAPLSRGVISVEYRKVEASK